MSRNWWSDNREAVWASVTVFVAAMLAWWGVIMLVRELS